MGSSQTCRWARPEAQAQLSFVLLPRRQLFAKLSFKAFIKKLDGMKFFQCFFAVAGPKVSQAQRIVSLQAVRLQFHGSLQQSQAFLLVGAIPIWRRSIDSRNKPEIGTCGSLYLT